LIVILTLGVFLLVSQGSDSTTGLPPSVEGIRTPAAGDTARPDPSPGLAVTPVVPSFSDTPGSPPAVAPGQATVSTPEATTSRLVPAASPSSPIGPTPNPTEGVIGDPPTPPGRLAPEVLADPLLIREIRVFKDPGTGLFSGRANVTNAGKTFLNRLAISWRIVDATGQVLDRGQIEWPNLAPGETATLPLNGSAAFADAWARVEFDYRP
jgi:hypothetical protein